MTEEQKELILYELEKAKRDHEYRKDHTRFYDGKITALEQVCRILRIPNPYL